METGLSEKCQAIMRATLELVAEQGFHGTPTSQIASRAGVGVGSIYRYFKDKDELIHGVHKQLEERLQSALVEGLGQELPDRGRFIHLITNLMHYLIAHPQDFRFLEQYYNSPFGIEKMREKFIEENQSGAECEKPFMDIFAGGKDGTIKDLPKPVIHALAFGPAIFSVRDHLAGLQELDEGLIKAIAAGCWDAIRK